MDRQVAFMSETLKVAFLEPYDGGSHRAFRLGLESRSRHRIEQDRLVLSVSSARTIPSFGALPRVPPQKS